MAAENFASRRDNSKILTARNFVSRRKSRQDSHRGLAAKLPAEISISRRDITSRSRRVLAAEISVSRRVFACRDFHISLRSRRESRRDRGAFLAAEISRISARIAARSRRVFGRRDFPYLAVISARWGNLGGQKRAAISPRSRRDSRRDRGEISARSRKNFHKGCSYNSNKLDFHWSIFVFFPLLNPKFINWRKFSVLGVQNSWERAPVKLLSSLK